jgi:hypothetical protein
MPLGACLRCNGAAVVRAKPRAPTDHFLRLRKPARAAVPAVSCGDIAENKYRKLRDRIAEMLCLRAIRIL